MEFEPGEGKVAGAKIGGEFGLERLCRRARNFVLDRDVKLAPPAVLRGQHAVEALDHIFVHGRQSRAVDRKRSASAQRHQPGYPRRWRSGGAVSDEQPPDLVLDAGRQRIEQGDVGADLVALGREVRPAQAVRPREDIGWKLCGDQQRGVR